jgi:MFS family permease
MAGAGPEISRGHRTTIAASVAIVLSAVPPFFTGALMPIMRRDLDIGTDRLGIIVAVYFAAGAVSAIPGGRLVERLGPRRGILTAAALSAGSLIAIAAASRSWVHVAAAMAVAGGANGMQHPGTNLAILRGVPVRRHGVAFGIKQAAAPTATLLAGSAVSAVAVTAGWRWVFLTAALMLPVIALLLPRDSVSIPQSVPRAPSEPTRILIRIAVAAGLGFGAATTLGAFLVDSVVSAGGSARAAGLALAAASAACIAVRLAAGWHTDRAESPSLGLVAGMLLVGAAGFLALATGGSSPIWPVAAVVALGAGWGWPGLLYHAVAAANPDAPASATAFTTVGNTIGGALGPFTFGLIARHASFSAGWVMSASMAVLAALVVLPLRHRRVRE